MYTSGASSAMEASLGALTIMPERRKCLADIFATRLFLGFRPGHNPACSVTGTAKCHLHGPAGSLQQERGGSHAARDDYRLADRCIICRNIGASGTECPGCAFAMDTDGFTLPFNIMLLNFCNVMGDMVTPAGSRLHLFRSRNWNLGSGG